MGTKDELRSDIRSCFKVCKDLDEKYEKRCREIEHISSSQHTDIKLIASSVSQLAESMDTFVNDFKKHDEEEMLKYDIITKQQGRFIRGLWIAFGVIIGVGGVGSFVYWIVDLLNNLKGVTG